MQLYTSIKSTLKGQIKAHIGLLLTNLFFAANISGIKYFAVQNLAGPYGLNVVRSGVACYCFGSSFFLAVKRKKLTKKIL